MKERLAKLRDALELLKKASVFKKALAAEAALLVAVDLFEEIVEEIESLKGSQTDTDRQA
jgi:glycyl-tRNA synthetase beta subunit